MTYGVLKYIKDLIEKDIEEKKAEYDEAVSKEDIFAKRVREASEIKNLVELSSSYDNRVLPIYIDGNHVLITLDETKKKADELRKNIQNKEIALKVAKSVRDSFLNTDWVEK